MPAQARQIPSDSEPGTLSSFTTSETQGNFPPLSNEDEELVEQDIRDRFRRMCEGYFDNVAKKLVMEHKVRGPTRPHTTCTLTWFIYSASKNRTVAIMKPTFVPVKYSRTGNKHTRKCPRGMKSSLQAAKRMYNPLRYVFH